MEIGELHGVEPYRQSVAEVLAAFATDAQSGLSQAQATKKLKQHGPNELAAERLVPAWRRLLGQFTDVLVLLLLAAALISAGLWLHERDSALPYEALAIFAIVLLNALMGFYQQGRAAQALAGLRGSLDPQGVALFNFGRQFGGLIGIAFLLTCLEDQIALNLGALSINFTPGNPWLAERQTAAAEFLASRGYNPDEAVGAAVTLIQRQVQQQVAVLSFNEVFLAIALVFVVAVAVLIAAKLILGRLWVDTIMGGRRDHHLAAIRLPRPRYQAVAFTSDHPSEFHGAHPQGLRAIISRAGPW